MAMRAGWANALASMASSFCAESNNVVFVTPIINRNITINLKKGFKNT
jgi:hypothetical protein